MWRHEIATTAIVLETEVRAAGYCDLRPLVPEILLELSRPGRAHGGARLGRRPYLDLGVSLRKLWRALIVGPCGQMADSDPEAKQLVDKLHASGSPLPTHLARPFRII